MQHPFVQYNIDDASAHPVGGMHILIREGKWRISLVNGTMLHSFPYAWEAAIKRDDTGRICYCTPLTQDVEVFDSTEATHKFIASAIEWFKNNPDHVCKCQGSHVFEDDEEEDEEDEDD